MIEPITLYLTFVVLPNIASSPALPIDAANLQSPEVNASVPQESTTFIAQDSTDVVRSIVTTDHGTFASQKDHSLSTHMPPVVDPRTELSLVGNVLETANEAMTEINNSDTWEGALERIKWVMDTVSPVAEVRYSVIFAILY